MRRIGTAALLVALGACSDAPADRPSRHDCEAVLAHLIVLEQPAVDRMLCKYHAACDGAERKRFVEMCPRVLSRREARCYQRATSLALADTCLPRSELDARIMGSGGQSHDRAGPSWLGL